MSKGTAPIKAPKKLIEVALPLDDINEASAYEKMPGIGAHPRGIHQWWARRPLAAARAVLFAQLVNDPGGERGYMKGKSKEDADRERERLFDIIRDLVKWENTSNEEVLERAREEIRKSWRETCELNKGLPGFDADTLPAFHDPFAGGGSLPLEAQRLGLEAHASDLNPVAVLINKAMIEIPPKFAGRVPVGPLPSDEKQVEMRREWQGAQGLAEDVRRYGRWMRDEAHKRIGHLYPDIEVTADMAKGRPDLKSYIGRRLTVIAWLWARTVKSPNPAYSHVDVPLVSSFRLSTKAGKEAWINPIVHGDEYRFEVNIGKPPVSAKDGTKMARSNFLCLVSGAPIDGKYIKHEGMAGRMGQRLMAIVAEGDRGRVYLPPIRAMEELARTAEPTWLPRGSVPERLTGGTCYAYGLTEWWKLFTPRQLVALNTFSDLVQEARSRIFADAKAAGITDDGRGLEQGGSGATAYADALSVYLAFAVDRSADFNNSLVRWNPSNQKIMNLFGRQAIPMVWDFAEGNILANVVGSFRTHTDYQSSCLLSLPAISSGVALHADAAKQTISHGKVISTDPPYYDNIGYADLSDFFYVWLRRTLKMLDLSAFRTIATPKEEELIASPYRQGSKDLAEQFFINGMTSVFSELAKHAENTVPITIYYAFKQSELKNLDSVSTGWETFLEAIMRSGLSITGTWPLRSEQSSRMIGMGTNALASSILLVCRPIGKQAATISRRDFQRLLREEMPQALRTMIGGSTGRSPIAPVDLAQASIGPGMAIFSRYESVLNQDGSRMSVHDALVLINREISDYLTPDAGDYDEDTRFCTQWFEQYGWKSGPFGEATVLARAKGTSVEGVVAAGVLEAKAGKVSLIKWSKYPKDWDPARDTRTPAWEALHHLIRLLDSKGEAAAGELLAAMPEKGEKVRQLAYHLYTICDRNKWAEDARPYNDLVTAWQGIISASTSSVAAVKQTEMEL